MDITAELQKIVSGDSQSRLLNFIVILLTHPRSRECLIT